MQMRSLSSRRSVAGGVAAAAFALAAAPSAHAVDCSTLTHPVYVTGSSAVKPFLAKAAAKLLPDITIVYYSQGSCAGVTAMTTDPPASLTQTGLVYWDNTGTAVTGGCDNTVGTGDVVDIGASDVYASTCGKTVAAGVEDKHGPIQTMTFVTPVGSSAKSISAEAAYMVFGFGASAADKQVAPWSVPADIFQRGAGSGTQAMIATAIGAPAAKWQGTTETSSSLMLGAVAAAGTNTGIGILATDLADLNRDKVTVLPYQHKDQSCGYLPDSTSTALDKANVRDGHYMIWGPLHLYVKSTMKDEVKAVVDALTLATDTDGTILAAEAKGGVIPECAMHVIRSSEVGALASFQPTTPCECRYLAEATGTAPANCHTCTTATEATDCAGQSRGTKCNYGYCEGN